MWPAGVLRHEVACDNGSCTTETKTSKILDLNLVKGCKRYCFERKLSMTPKPSNFGWRILSPADTRPAPKLHQWLICAWHSRCGECHSECAGSIPKQVCAGKVLVLIWICVMLDFSSKFIAFHQADAGHWTSIDAPVVLSSCLAPGQSFGWKKLNVTGQDGTRKLEGSDPVESCKMNTYTWFHYPACCWSCWWPVGMATCLVCNALCSSSCPFTCPSADPRIECYLSWENPKIHKKGTTFIQKSWVFAWLVRTHSLAFWTCQP